MHDQLMLPYGRTTGMLSVVPNKKFVTIQVDYLKIKLFFNLAR